MLIQTAAANTQVKKIHSKYTSYSPYVSKVYQAWKKFIVPATRAFKSIIFHWQLLYEKRVIKLYLNFTVILSIILLTIKSKLENIYRLKDGQSSEDRVIVLFFPGIWGFKPVRKRQPTTFTCSCTNNPQHPCIFPMLFSPLARLVFSNEATSRFLWRYSNFNSSLPSVSVYLESALPIRRWN